MDLLTGKIISMLLLGALSLFFGLIPLKIQKKLMKTDEGKSVETQKRQRRRRDLVVSCLLCFGAGVLLATVFLHMLPETRENVALIHKQHYGDAAKHEHLRGEKSLSNTTENESLDRSLGMLKDDDESSTRLLSHPATAGASKEHSHDENHVHKRSAERNQDLAPTSENSKLNSDTSEKNEHDHGNHNHNHEHATHNHRHEHEAVGDSHGHKKALELIDGSGDLPVAINTENSQTETVTEENEMLTTAMDENDVVQPLRNNHTGHLHSAGDNNHDHDHSGHDHSSHDHSEHDHSGHDHSDHDHSGHDHSSHDHSEHDHSGHDHSDHDHSGHDHSEHDHSEHDHSGHDHSGHDHDHGKGHVDEEIEKLTNSRRDPATGRRMKEENPLANDSLHMHNHHDHDTEILPLHRGKNASSSAPIQDFLAHEHDHHHHHDEHEHDHDSPSHAHAHGEHEHDHDAHAYPIAELLICIGFFFVYLVEEIVHKVVFHKHSHSKRGSKTDGSMVLKNRHCEEDRFPPVTNGTYRTRSVHSNVHPYAVENGTTAPGDAKASNGGSGLPPKDVWSSSGVDNPSFVNETEVDGSLNHHVKDVDLVDVPLNNLQSMSNSSTVRSFPYECETPKEPLFSTRRKKSSKNKNHENNNISKAEIRMQRLFSITSDYGSQNLNEDDHQMTVVPCYDTMGNTLITRRIQKRRHSSPIVPEHLMLQMSRVSVTPHTVGHGHSHVADISELKSQDWVSNLRSLIIVLALSFHAVFEGLAVGLQQNVQDVWYLFYAIAAHKLVIAFCVGLELISGGTKICLTVVYMVVFALVTPLGIAVGIIVTEGTSSPDSFAHMWTVTVLQGIAGGTILYVTFCEVLERERNRKNGRFLKLLALVIGFSTMAIIELVGAHKHTH